MSKIKKFIALMLSVIMITGLFDVATIISFAAGSNNDPVSIEISTDKNSYSLMNTANVTVKVTNVGNSTLNNVNIAAESSELLYLNSNGQKYYSVGSLEKGKSATWTFSVILSSSSNGLGFFQRLFLTLKKLFTPSSTFKNSYNNDEQSVTLSTIKIDYAGLNTEIKAFVYYDNTIKIVNANDIDSYSSAVSSLIKEQMDDKSFDSFAAEQNEYYSGRILLKGKNVDLENCDAETIIAGPDDTYIIQFDSPAKAISFQTEQSNKSNIEFAEPDRYIFLDPLESETIYEENSFELLSSNSWGVEHIQADKYATYLKDNNYNSSVTVAVIDTGVELDHPYLKQRLLNIGHDFIDDDETPDDLRGHGTHVAGTIVDCTEGLPNIKILPLKVFGSTGSTSDGLIALAIKYAVEKKANIINMSLGGGCSDYIDSEVNEAIKSGITVCVSAGNDSADTVDYCPAHISTPGCITVSAIDSSNKLANFSNFGNAIDVGAPGVGIKSCIPGKTYGLKNGTSMAAPHVSACAAMLKLANPSASPAQIENYIRQYTLDIGASGRDNFFGYGVPKMSKAIPKTNYTVTYNANGGSVSPASATVESGSSVSLPTPTKKYTITYNASGGTSSISSQSISASCKGWSTSSSATSASYSCGSSYTPMNSITLYAVWGNATGTVTTTTPTRSGYSFAGWSTSSSATTSVEYTAGSSISINKSIILYAVWSRNPSTYTITYNANGGSTPPASQTKTENIDLILSTVMPTRTGYTFLGWSTNSSATSPTYPAGGTYTANASATLYAVWKINTYTISYNANGGSGAPSPQTKTYGQSLTLSSTKPTRSGYTFLGWSTNSSATSATYSAGGTYTANESVTLYAVWKKISYTLTYNANGGSGAPSSQTGNGTVKLSTTVPTRSGYVFGGWSTVKNSSSNVYSSGSNFNMTENTTLYAYWLNITLSSTSGSASYRAITGGSANIWRYTSQSVLGWSTELPTPYNSTLLGNNAYWELVSGDGKIVGDTLYMRQPGTYKARYHIGNSTSQIYTFTLTYGKEVSTTQSNIIRSTPGGADTGKRVPAGAGYIPMTEVQYTGSLTGSGHAWGKITYNGTTGWITICEWS